MLSFISLVMMIIGYWGIFVKCGKKGWHALVPFVGEYEMAQCADREKDGIPFAIFSTLYQIFAIAVNFTEEGSDAETIFLMLGLLCWIPYVILNIRIFIGLCERFQRKKRWLILWIPVEAVPAFIWGVFKQFRPKAITKKDPVEIGGIDVTGTDQDLTINITDRTVMSSFKKRVLLKDIHMNIKPGRMVLLLGGSGAGKTTFLNAVTGYEKANAQIELGSGDVYKDYKRMKYDIGFVPQQDLMRGNDTVYRTLADAAELRLPTSVNGTERKKRIQQMLESFGLSMLSSSLVNKLSGGQRKRLSIAMEFISDPSLFILDEPDSGLDGVVARGLFEKLREIADEGKIVIVITHTPDRVIDLFDDVIVLAKDSDRSGRLTYFGPINEAYDFFGKDSMEGILLAINQKEEGGEGRAEELVKKYSELIKEAEAS